MVSDADKKRTEQQIDVMLAYINGKRIECRIANPPGKWHFVDHPMWAWQMCEYREYVGRPDSIDWSAVGKEYNWLARDSDGRAYLFSSTPAKDCTMWRSTGGNFIKASAFSSYVRGNTAWDASLVIRPIGG